MFSNTEGIRLSDNNTINPLNFQYHNTKYLVNDNVLSQYNSLTKSLETITTLTPLVANSIIKIESDLNGKPVIYSNEITQSANIFITTKSDYFIERYRNYVCVNGDKIDIYSTNGLVRTVKFNGIFLDHKFVADLYEYTVFHDNHIVKYGEHIEESKVKLEMINSQLGYRDFRPNCTPKHLYINGFRLGFIYNVDPYSYTTEQLDDNHILISSCNSKTYWIYENISNHSLQFSGGVVDTSIRLTAKLCKIAKKGL